jgi:dienelactone hydrolase
MGCVVFSYDMVGYNDSGRQIDHRWRSDREELWGISVMGLQTWNSIRVIDFLQGLPDVDADRIGVTGASGGGTQTFMVMGIEPRVKVAAPVNMISCSMQGGCVGENAPLLRIETNSMEIAALMAPRPLLMVSATGDWTKETPKVEYPAIRNVFALYSATDRVTNVHVKAPHNYNRASREAMYAFFRRHLLGVRDAKPFVEPPFTIEKKEDLLVWQGRDLPKGAKNRETLGEYIIAGCVRQRGALLPKKPEDRQRFDDTLGALYRHAVLAELPAADQVLTRARQPLLLLGRKGRGDAVPAAWHQPKLETTRACLVIHPDGKAAVTPDHPLVAALLDADRAVLAIDPYLVGDSPDPAVLKENQKNKNFFAAYNRTIVVERVQDILTAVAWLRARGGAKSVDVVGLDKAGAWCLLAAPFLPEGIRVVADLAQLSGDDDSRWLHDLFSPCILKAGGLWTATALAAPQPLFLHNIAKGFDTRAFRAAYHAAGAADALRLESRACGATAIVRWLDQ